MQVLQSPTERQKELYSLAESQSGFFTAKQAEALGYTSNKRIYHVRAGNWVREHRGIYRLALPGTGASGPPPLDAVVSGQDRSADQSLQSPDCSQPSRSHRCKPREDRPHRAAELSPRDSDPESNSSASGSSADRGPRKLGRRSRDERNQNDPGPMGRRLTSETGSPVGFSRGP